MRTAERKMYGRQRAGEWTVAQGIDGDYPITVSTPVEDLDLTIGSAKKLRAALDAAIADQTRRTERRAGDDELGVRGGPPQDRRAGDRTRGPDPRE